MNERCAEVKEQRKRDQPTYSKVKEVMGKKNLIKNKDIKKSYGKVAMENEYVKLRWSEYVGEI